MLCFLWSCCSFLPSFTAQRGVRFRYYEYYIKYICDGERDSPKANVVLSHQRHNHCLWTRPVKVNWERDISVQLPCEDDNFLHQIPCKTEGLLARGFLNPSEDMSKSSESEATLGYRSFLIRVYAVSARILRYLKRYEQEEYPWRSSSEFSLLLSALEHIRNSLPSSLQFIPENIYISKEKSVLSPLIFLHLAYHQRPF